MLAADRRCSRSLLPALGLVAGLGLACSSEKTPASSQWTPITGANALAIASTVWLDHTAREASEVLDETEVLLDRYLPMVALQPAGSKVELQCEVSGKISLTGHVADPAHPGAGAGDTVTAAHTACRDEPYDPNYPSFDTTGELVLTVVAPGTAQQTLSATFKDLKSTWGATAFTLNGTRTYLIARQGNVTTVTASSAKMTVSGSMAMTVEDQEIRLVDGGEAWNSPYELTFQATVSGDRVGGKVRIETPAAFRGSADAYPSSGQMLVHGAAGSTLRVTAIDATSVRLEVDENGDGAAEPANTVVRTWQAFEDGDESD